MKRTTQKVVLIESGKREESIYPLNVDHSYLAKNTFTDYDQRGKPFTRTITPRELFIYKGVLQDTSESLHLKYLNSLSDKAPDWSKDELERLQLNKVKFKGLNSKHIKDEILKQMLAVKGVKLDFKLAM